MIPNLLGVSSHEIFEHRDGRIIDITSLRKSLSDKGAVRELFAFPMWNVEEMLQNHEWDENREERVFELMERIGKEKTVPALLCLMPGKKKEGMWVDIIDGWHTLTILSRHAKKMNLDRVQFPTHMISEKDIKPFIVPKYAMVGKISLPPAGERDPLTQKKVGVM